MTYPATNSNEATQLIIDSGNQIHEVINGSAVETVTTDSGEIPTLRKALTDNFYFLDPLDWVNGQDEEIFNQIRIFTDGTFWIAPFATALNPIPMGATPYGDSNWVITGLTKVPDGYVLLNVTDLQPTTPIPFVTNQFTYQFIGRPVKTTDYYVTSGTGIDSTQLLVPNKDYTFTDLDSDTITLTDSWEGFEIFAKSITINGSGYSRSPNTFTVDGLTESLSLNAGDEVVVPERGNARYVIRPSGWVLLSGDISLDSGQVAELQRSSQGTYNIEWFGADGSDNTIDQLTYFNLAAARSNEDINGATKVTPIVIPKGDWRVSVPVSQSSVWILLPNAVMYGLPAVSPSNERDTSYLTGSVIIYHGVDQQRTMQMGDPSAKVQKYTGKAYTSEITGNGKIAGGVTGTAHASDRTSNSEGIIALTGVAIADNSIIDQDVWAAYLEAYKVATADQDSNVNCMESTIFNDGTLVTASPYRLLNGGKGTTTNLWLTTGGLIQGGTQISGDTTMCIGMKGKEGSQYHRGIVVSTDTISTKEVLATPADHSWDWYDVKTDNTTEVRAARIRARLANDNAGLFEMSLYDSSLAGYRQLYNFGLDNFTAGDSRTNLGAPLLAWLNGYFENSPTVTSDERYKTKRNGSGEFSEAEVNAGRKIAKLPRMFQWTKEVNEKGEYAYLHCSPMAQSVWSALESEGLDPTLYGFVNKGDKWTIQTQEILSMVCYSQQVDIENLNNDVSYIKSRLAALEALNG